MRDIHAEMARMRAIEQGFALVRPTMDGTMMMTDSAGRILASLTSQDDRTALLVADIPVKHRFTFYSLTGDSFGVLCGRGFLSILSMAGFGGC